MKKYKKPQILASNGQTNIVPLATVAAAGVGGAFLAGVATGLMKDDKFINSIAPSLDRVELSPAR